MFDSQGDYESFEKKHKNQDVSCNKTRSFSI